MISPTPIDLSSVSQRKPPATDLAFLGVVLLTPFFLWVWIDPGTTRSLQYDYQVIGPGIANKAHYIYSTDKHTVCRYNSNSYYSEGGDKIRPVYFMSSETYEGVTYYPVGALSRWNGFDYVGPGATMTCNTDRQLLVKRYRFMDGAGDARVPILVFFGLCYATLLIHNLYQRFQYNRDRPK